MSNSNPEKIIPSPEQQAIIDSKEDTMVVSNPGTGKTTTLALKVIDLLEKKFYASHLQQRQKRKCLMQFLPWHKEDFQTRTL